jgi:hypothetical protein
MTPLSERVAALVLIALLVAGVAANLGADWISRGLLDAASMFT